MSSDAPDTLFAPLRDAAQTLGLNLSEAQLQQLLAYLAMISKWNKVYNLTAVREPQAMLTQHLVDSLSLLPALRRHSQSSGQSSLRLMDVGSGGGLPGVVVAICEPNIDVTCVDAVAKKASFIKQVAAELRLPNLHGEHSRVEALNTSHFDLITSRAFASLLDFTTLTRQHLKPGADSGAIWLAMKGQHPSDELAALPADLDVFHVEQLQVPGLNAQRCLIWIRPKA
ncbi:16S rRNA (guanine(527)-N(7))-methyltransferase RsmG [Paucibacter sp. DJ1R-11]|uniref:16S rRNA (guanine(527)-N(7))-methyltransferase RsmG n=1 Tax=Paucibacter sp. DJ1R-11 TaxID=2893556 RepID=UPI0021E3A9A5|nr:16S rRNA (guanine(527)-N(7))-methyltransferase RsmG [Paucibacter sp. DJ1R-11]MCV2363035.1 16S rRNA (guanine(527)-N(7))-methyltransferase RsmG [Paucibacter sp. DJ1R-11]